jgi:photosystem II stability/assembly factor-like uncharacterized protein
MQRSPFVETLEPRKLLSASSIQWQPMGESGVGGRIDSIAVSPHDSDRVLVGGDILYTGLSRDAAQTWEATTGWDAGQISDFTYHPTDPDIVWAGTLSGPHVSFDGGRTWEDRRSNMVPDPKDPVDPDDPVFANPNDPNFGHSYAIEKILFDPSDAPTPGDDSNDLPYQVLLAFGGDHRELKLSSPGQTPNYGYVWRSTDAGVTWTTTANRLDGNIVAVDYAGTQQSTIWAATTEGVFRSNGDGPWATWSPKNSGLPAFSDDIRPTGLVAHPTKANIAYLTVGVRQGTGNRAPVGGIFETRNGGTSWQRVSQGVPNSQNPDGSYSGNPPEFRHIDISADGSVLWASDINWGQSKGLWRGTFASTNDDSVGAISWEHVLTQNNASTLITTGSPMTIGSEVGAWWVEIDPNDKNTVYAGSSSNMIRSTDGGATWADYGNQRDDNSKRFRGTGFSGWVANNFEVSPYTPNLHIAQGFDRLLASVSRDGGFYWEIDQPGLPKFNAGRDVAFAQNDIIFAALGQKANTTEHLARSRDNGTNWVQLPSPTEPNGDVVEGVATSVHVDPGNPNLAWVTIDGGLYQSVNANANIASNVQWTKLLTNGPRIESIHAISQTPTGAQANDFLLATNQGVYKTTNGGTSIQPVGGTGALNPTKRVRLATPENNSGDVWAASNEKGVFHYDGSVWNAITLPNQAHKWAKDVAVDPTNPDRIAIATGQDPFVTVRGGTGVWLSDDGGQTWTNENGALPSDQVNTVDFTPDGNRLVAGASGRGFFVADLTRPGVGVEAELMTVGGRPDSAFEVGFDPTAQGGRYLHVPQGSGNNWLLNGDAAVAKYVFELDQPATNVTFSARTQAPNGNADNSTFVRVNDGPWYIWDTPTNRTGWTWSDIKGRGIGNLKVDLDAGINVLEFKHREDGTRLDAIEVNFASNTPAAVVGRQTRAVATSVFSNHRIRLDLLNEVGLGASPTLEERVLNFD